MTKLSLSMGFKPYERLGPRRTKLLPLNLLLRRGNVTAHLAVAGRCPGIKALYLVAMSIFPILATNCLHQILSSNLTAPGLSFVNMGGSFSTGKFAGPCKKLLMLFLSKSFSSSVGSGYGNPWLVGGRHTTALWMRPTLCAMEDRVLGRNSSPL